MFSTFQLKRSTRLRLAHQNTTDPTNCPAVSFVRGPTRTSIRNRVSDSNTTWTQSREAGEAASRAPVSMVPPFFPRRAAGRGHAIHPSPLLREVSRSYPIGGGGNLRGGIRPVRCTARSCGNRPRRYQLWPPPSSHTPNTRHGGSTTCKWNNTIDESVGPCRSNPKR